MHLVSSVVQALRSDCISHDALYSPLMVRGSGHSASWEMLFTSEAHGGGQRQRKPRYNSHEEPRQDIEINILGFGQNICFQMSDFSIKNQNVLQSAGIFLKTINFFEN